MTGSKRSIGHFEFVRGTGSVLRELHHGTGLGILLFLLLAITRLRGNKEPGSKFAPKTIPLCSSIQHRPRPLLILKMVNRDLQKQEVRAREPASFWRENMVAVVIL